MQQYIFFSVESLAEAMAVPETQVKLPAAFYNTINDEFYVRSPDGVKVYKLHTESQEPPIQYATVEQIEALEKKLVEAIQTKGKSLG